MSASQTILGVRFFDGSVDDAVRTICERRGLLVVPAAPALVNIQYDAAYREALLGADLAIADSGFMVLLWRLLKRRRITRISGLAYLSRLLAMPELRTTGAAFFILPSEAAREKAIAFLRSRGWPKDADVCYIAPQYCSHGTVGRTFVSPDGVPQEGGYSIRDPALLAMLNQRRPPHVIIAIGGGTQEKLGLFLREHLEYRPAIHCIGAALGFLTGDQKPIPRWADRLYLGWLLRLARDPRRYARRFAVARELPGLISKYGSELPPVKRRKGKVGSRK